MPEATPSLASRQDEIRGWFDATYARRGLRYLRPVEAYQVFLTILGARPGQRLLDVACGPGQLLSVAQAAGLVTAGIDLSGEAVRMCRERLPAAEVFEANAERLPFPAGSFDCVTCLGSLERMLDRAAALQEMRRVLRPDGRVCLLVRNAGHPWWPVWRWLGLRNETGHQDAASVEAWGEAFHAAGFRILRVLPDQWPLMWPARLRRRLGLGADFSRIRRGGRPLRWAYECIFLLEAAGQ